MMIPDIAAGTVTLQTVSNFVAPNPNDASLKLLGTAFNASSLIDATNGVIIIPTANEALNTLNVSTLN